MDISQYVQIIAIVVIFAIYIYGLPKVVKRNSPNKWNIFSGFTVATLFLIYLIFYIYKLEPKDFAQIFLTFGLVLVTTLYANSTAKQANASVQMAEEMREQRIMAARPYLIPKPVYEKDIYEGSTSRYLDHFAIINKSKMAWR